MIGWIGNTFIILGLIGVGNRRRGAFLFSIIGELIYISRSYIAGDWSLFWCCVIFLLMAVRGYILWGRVNDQ